MRKLAILVAVAMVCGACSATTSTSPRSGGELRVGLIADLVTLDPAGQATPTGGLPRNTIGRPRSSSGSR